MEPCVVGAWLYVLFEIAEGVALASPHLPDFVIEEAGDEDTEFEDIEDEVVHIFKGNGKLAEDLDGAADALDGFVFAEEGGDVEHAWSLALADEAEAEGVHDVAEFVALALNPLEDDGFLGLDGEVVDGLKEVSELCHDLC